MDDQDKILAFLKETGPTIPSRVAKLIGTQILLASAHLADLVSREKVKLSHLKIGGSPLYYLAGQEEMLYSFAENNLNPKDFQVLNRLKEEKILREAELDLLAKVALRSLKDFAIPIHVSMRDKTELFWRWHLLSKEETNEAVKDFFSRKESRSELDSAEKNLETGLEEKKVEVQQTILSEVLKEEPLLEKEDAAELQLIKNVLHPREERKDVKFREKLKEKKEKARFILKKEELVPSVREFLKDLEITVESKEIVRKNLEVNFLVTVPSIIGEIKYFCKVKSKAKCDEKDLSVAYLEAQIKKLPLLFLYSEQMSKKAEEMLKSGAFENVIVKKIE